MTRRATVVVFDPAFIHDKNACLLAHYLAKIYANHIENPFCDTGYIVACTYFGRCLEMGLHVTAFEVFFF
jgi:hypothetical protein